MKPTVIIVICTLVVAIAPLAVFMGYFGPKMSALESKLDAALIPNTLAPAATTTAAIPTATVAAPAPAPAVDATPDVPFVPLPPKFEASHAATRYYQENRGTCWAFATVGLLEESYRQAGMSKGYLKSDEYVRFSQQTYAMLQSKACQAHPEICGDGGYEQNVTEGGSVWWLYYFSDLYTKILPHAVCPYTEEEQQWECPGIDKALAYNPVRFDIKKMITAYSVEDTKRMVVSTGASVGVGSVIWHNIYTYPCSDPFWAKQPECVADVAVRCPTDAYYNSDKCAEVPSCMFDVDGEFTIHGRQESEGGHAMLIVGYNDEFITKSGTKGGFIFKNSWHNIVYPNPANEAGRGARGSHSVAYWMQQISAQDEKLICPNPQNPENWGSCIPGGEEGPHGAKATSGKHHHHNHHKAPVTSDSVNYDLSGCLDHEAMAAQVNQSFSPLEFTCTDASFCSKDSKYRYFMLSYQRNEDMQLARMCMLQYNTATKTQAVLCTPFINPSKIAFLFSPIKWMADALPDSEDLCGYWFWPYDVTNRATGLFQDFQTTYYEIDWADSSFLANAAKYAGQYDYSLLAQSSGKLPQYSFNGPWPYATKRL